ncbi:MAG: 4'-phosphopantetheinyl transferase superfamily protein [Pseudomonas sp.]|uniref:4'-phosphopantetheinyl transferase family protein n=1 Tax=Pseudomonas sp. TaxID=306 RepID=UPI003392E473
MSLSCRVAPYPAVLARPGIRIQACRFEHGEQPLQQFAADGLDPLLLPDALRQAVPKRQAEFLAGRYCAALACRALDGTQPSITIGPGRAPQWPVGRVGSISHVQGYALCAVAKRTDFIGLGIDVETLTPGDDLGALARQIASDAELACLGRQRGDPLAFTLLFSAKEAIYKALYPEAQRFIDFDEVQCVGATYNQLHFQTGPGLNDLFPNGQRLQVLYGQWQHLIFTLCAREAR